MNRIKRIICFFRRHHKWEWFGGIGNMDGKPVDDDYECQTCGNTISIHHPENVHKEWDEL